jgi:hypothetical protein
MSLCSSPSSPVASPKRRPPDELLDLVQLHYVTIPLANALHIAQDRLGTPETHDHAVSWGRLSPQLSPTPSLMSDTEEPEVLPRQWGDTHSPRSPSYSDHQKLRARSPVHSRSQPRTQSLTHPRTSRTSRSISPPKRSRRQRAVHSAEPSRMVTRSQALSKRVGPFRELDHSGRVASRAYR